MLIATFRRFVWWQIHRSHNIPDNLSLTEDALVREEMKTLLSPVEDHAATRRSLVLNLGWNCAFFLEPRPVFLMSGRMR